MQVSLAHSHIQRSAYAVCSIAQPRTVHGFPLYTVAYKPEHKIFGLGFSCPCPFIDYVLLSGLHYDHCTVSLLTLLSIPCASL